VEHSTACGCVIVKKKMHVVVNFSIQPSKDEKAAFGLYEPPGTAPTTRSDPRAKYKDALTSTMCLSITCHRLRLDRGTTDQTSTRACVACIDSPVQASSPFWHAGRSPLSILLYYTSIILLSTFMKRSRNDKNVTWTILFRKVYEKRTKLFLMK
jgi:hypothetical protein